MKKSKQFAAQCIMVCSFLCLFVVRENITLTDLSMVLLQKLVFALLLCSLLASLVYASDLYCGDKNCYDALELSSSATPSEIKKAFHKLSLK